MPTSLGQAPESERSPSGDDAHSMGGDHSTEWERLADHYREIDRRVRDLEGEIKRGYLPLPGMSDADREYVASILDELSSRTAKPIHKLVTEAIALLDTAAEEEGAGHRLAFLDSDNTIIREIRGFAGRPASASRPS